MILPDLVRSAVFLSLLLLQCHHFSLTISQQSSSIFVQFRQFAVVWIASKGPFYACCVFLLGVVVREFVCVGVRFVRHLIPQQIFTHHFFNTWFRARTRIRWIVFGVSMFALVFSPVRFGSKTTCSWN
jgi:hypothetical protein